MTLAYIVSRSPVLTETFIRREIHSLRRMGWPIEVFALRQMSECRAHTGFEVRFPCLPHRVCHPERVPRLLRMTVAGHRSSARVLAKALLAFGAAVGWAEQMRAINVHHIHAHFGSYPALAALVAAELQDITFSFTMHAHDLFADNDMLAEKTHHAQFVIVISEFNRRRLMALVPSAEADRVKVIHCGVDPAAFSFVERCATPPRNMLCVAALRDYKGLHTLLEACWLLRAWPFVCRIVGEGPERRALERHIAARGLERIVRLEGAADERTVQSFLAKADTFVLPSIVGRNGYMDGVPVALMEAMACGVPVIASRLSGIPELVRDEDTGLLVAPGDPEALSRTILRTWSEPALTAMRARRARALIERAYNLHNTSLELAREFARVNPLPLEREETGEDDRGAHRR